MRKEQIDYTRALRESNRLKAPTRESIIKKLEEKLLSYGVSEETIQKIGDDVVRTFKEETLTWYKSEKKPRFYVNLYGDEDTMTRALTNSLKTYTKQVDGFMIVSDKTTNKVSLFVSLERLK